MLSCINESCLATDKCLLNQLVTGNFPSAANLIAEAVSMMDTIITGSYKTTDAGSWHRTQQHTALQGLNGPDNPQRWMQQDDCCIMLWD